MTSFKMRAERQFEIDLFFACLRQEQINYFPITIRRDRYDSVEVKFNTRLTYKQVVEKLNKIPGGNIMSETIDFSTVYTGKRT